MSRTHNSIDSWGGIGFIFLDHELELSRVLLLPSPDSHFLGGTVEYTKLTTYDRGRIELMITKYSGHQ
jgi:hypothetical protein